MVNVAIFCWILWSLGLKHHSVQKKTKLMTWAAYLDHTNTTKRLLSCDSMTS